MFSNSYWNNKNSSKCFSYGKHELYQINIGLDEKEFIFATEVHYMENLFLSVALCSDCCMKLVVVDLHQQPMSK